MLILPLIGIAWLTACVMAVGLCVMARRGDETTVEPAFVVHHADDVDLRVAAPQPRASVVAAATALR